MAFNDTLFQLGMDLTRSSTAQKEDLNEIARVAHEDRKDYFIERDGVRFAGQHLIIDLFGARRVDDLKHVERTLKRCVEVAGATLLHIHLHHFTPNGGVSGVAVLSESHISIHSWPEADYAALDVFMCGNCQPQLCVDVLREAFFAREVIQRAPARREARRCQMAGGGGKESSGPAKERQEGEGRLSGLFAPTLPSEIVRPDASPSARYLLGSRYIYWLSFSVRSCSASCAEHGT
jgi:S-adenosylmethionine decarboxylase